ncbi:MAG: T9SS type A sorting domain-containing protein [Bacteroidetes bacterium]|nr:T9SS type A sorting domain-containing protein [Bacteroidota bacterium]
MKKIVTLNPFAGSKKSTIMALAIILFVSAAVFMGCYKFRHIYQPTDGYTNSYFDVPIVCQRDDDPSLTDDMWANTLQNIGLFGVMIPDGWNVGDSIAYTIISKNSSLNNTGYLIHNLANSKTLKDSIPPLPGYHWWGAVTDRIAELTSLDSFYFTPRIITDGKVGTFFLRYAVGDKDYWDRNPADRYNYGGGLSDPISINITSGVGVPELLSSANISVYPNPSLGQLHIDLKGYKKEVIRMNIVDAAGKVVMSREILQPNNEINIASLAAGSYIVELRNGQYRHSTKILLK